MKSIQFIQISFLLIIGLYQNGITASALQDKMLDEYGIDVIGFTEARQGWRLQNTPHQKDISISELRLQMEITGEWDLATINFKGDFYGDLVDESINADVRSLNVLVSPFGFMDIRGGRQMLTWGTGDLLFINDFFPKDWVSFFTGRDDEYLKAPSDALRISVYTPIFNTELIYVPMVNSSVYIDGARLSYWNRFQNKISGSNYILHNENRDNFPDDGEFAGRLYRNMGSMETSIYGFYGFWKTPEGFNPSSGKLIYPRLSAGGASVRAPIFGGIGNMEGGYYYSSDNTDGDNPIIRNSEVRFLAGFEREISSNLTAGIQYYGEWMQDYDEYLKLNSSLPNDEFRQLITLRLRKLLLNQNLILSFFTYYSPSDNDAYIRPKVKYKVTDAIALELGVNIFVGEHQHTFFAQFEDNNNAYGSLRWSF
ncbi:MAG: hypothetical protein HQK83_02125 [Fibrobacteria bacterium]|nr:hypothetical protein [Fibrobacteria bacterium]